MANLIVGLLNMSPGAKIGFGILMICFIIIVIAIAGGFSSSESSSTTDPSAGSASSSPSASTTPEVKAVPTSITIQVDNQLDSVSVNGKKIFDSKIDKPIAGWANLYVLNVDTKPGDIIKFAVKNEGGPGGLRAAVTRGDITYRTGHNSFAPNVGQVVNLMNTPWSWAVTSVYNPQTPKDVATKMGNAEWVWSNNLCEVCTVEFSLII